MPKLSEVIAMFEQFGMPEEYVRRAMAVGESAFNAFEGLKSCLQLRWAELCQELSAERQAELKPIYDRLMKISMKSRTMSDDQKVLDTLDGMKDGIERVKPWALVLKDMLEYEGNWTFGQQIRNFCVRRGLEYPPPEVESALLTTAFKYKAKGAPCPKGFA
ncbi:MAG: hypothetical protein GWN58_22820 [Anaerolineae bacterium]|nr:hypothetical protein [Thermoplasmata archaeon]NIV32208.1 hypothetical protein [Anaerolineae bacterium]NIY03660.1 hypothetical protein [Thermoplasmata archaeon]